MQRSVKSYINRLTPLFGLLVLGACTTMPSGPSVMVLPGTGKSFDQFRADDFECKQFAQGQLGGTTTTSAADDSGVRTAAFGTLLGAVAGAAINGSHGAAVGAGTGLALGGLSGAGAAQTSAGTVQQRYDMGYQQCMYAMGHRVPMSASFMPSQSRTYRSAPPPPPSVQPGGSIPPPPPGSPPPPPLR